MENEKKKSKLQEKMKGFLGKIKGVKKRYYVIFGLLVMFFIYNTITLRGFYYADNRWFTMFGFMDTWHGYTNAPNTSAVNYYTSSGYVPAPSDIHDTENSHEWYVSIFGTVVFMKWKWVGLHVGDHMVLIDTWVPDAVCYDNNIFGHPYYILHKYDNIRSFPEDDGLPSWVLEKLEKKFGASMRNSTDEAKKARIWMKNVGKYRRNTIIFYCTVLIIIVVAVVMGIRKRKKKRKDAGGMQGEERGLEIIQQE
ncbi:MAG: hypothetical protein J1E62_08855 [Lachnospiraceae bacterium]|nr:hypothetical protein [Lachnospiraceae bacterium]